MMRAPALAASLLLAFPAVTGAQERRVQSGFEFRTVSFDSGLGARSVRQLAIPFGVVIPLSPRFQIDAGVWYAQAERTEQGGASVTLSGLTDLQTRAVFEVVPDAVILTLSANLPTGHATLVGNEIDVAGAIASDMIPFPVTNFGSGFSLTSGVAFAMPVGSWAIGLAGSYRVNGEFQPLADTSGMYKPGGEMRLRLGVDRLLGQGRISLGLTWSDFSTDEFGGSGAYRSGSRYIPQVSLSIPLGNNSLAIYAWDVYRTAGEYVGSPTTAPKQNTLAAGAVLNLNRGRASLRPSLEIRKAWEDNNGMQDSGTLVSLGTRYNLPLGSRFTVVPSLRFDVGSIVGPSGEGVSLRGFSAGIALSTGW
jgi:hypothetical protein